MGKWFESYLVLHTEVVFITEYLCPELPVHRSRKCALYFTLDKDCIISIGKHSFTEYTNKGPASQRSRNFSIISCLNRPNLESRTVSTECLAQV